jgi:hypothetical protein
LSARLLGRRLHSRRKRLRLSPALFAGSGDP